MDNYLVFSFVKDTKEMSELPYCMNGGDIMDDAYEVSMRHEEEEYEEDPINTPRPSWMTW